MEENRDQILLDFQSCTGVEDIAECIMYLEATNWNLLDAINNVMPQETQTLPSEQQPEPLLRQRQPSIEELMVNEPLASITASLPPVQASAPPATASLSSLSLGMLIPDSLPLQPLPNNRVLFFFVNYKNKTVPLELPDSESIGTIKTALFAALGIPPCRQELRGLQRNHITDETILATLGLATQTHLQLEVPTVVSSSASSTSAPEEDQNNYADYLSLMYGVHVTDQTNQRDYRLKFPGSKTVSEVKQDVYAVTNIPVRHQRWSGWPDTASDENTTLAAVHLNYPVHELLLWDEGNAPKGPRNPIVDIANSESSGEEFEDAPECLTVDDSVFQNERQSKRMQPLMPDNMNDEAEALCHFTREFENRYGACHPAFFQGSLAEALQASCQKPAKERKPLVVYLHHDASVLTNVFCAQLLCSETIVSYLTFNFLTWAWDLTNKSNKTKLLASVTQHLGIAAMTAIRQILTDNLPALMVIGRVRSTTEVISVIPGNVGLDELMTGLVHGIEMFESGLATEIKEEDERQAREQVKQEQDEAYELSLEADRLKDQARQQEREMRMKLEEQERAQKEQMEQAKQHQEAVKEAERLSLAQQLPTEPPEDCLQPTTRIRIRLPSGQMLIRRFMAAEPLQMLLLYLASQGFPAQDFKVLGSWPRRDLSVLDAHQSFQDLNLFPQEMVTLEER